MDASVIAALAKWPNVPAVYGWLALTARGEWRLKGEPIKNSAIREFIGRNYAADDRGCWYFQNGPQRVFVELEATPVVYRWSSTDGITAHTNVRPQRCSAAAVLDGAVLLMETDIGPGIVDDRDVSALIEIGVEPDDGDVDAWLAGTTEARLIAKRLRLSGEPVRIERLAASAVPRRYGFTRRPAA